MGNTGTNLIKEITSNKFLLILMNEEHYPEKMDELIKVVEKSKTKICYVCLSKPYEYVVAEFRDKGLNLKDFFFIDVLSSHFSKPKPRDDCIFVSSPSNLDGVKEAVATAVKTKKCSVVVFDTISTLLIYEPNFSIVKFTNSLITEKSHEFTTKLFVILKGDHSIVDDVNLLTKDLEMLADKKIDMST
jgi:hypothetical protein